MAGACLPLLLTAYRQCSLRVPPPFSPPPLFPPRRQFHHSRVLFAAQKLSHYDVLGISKNATMDEIKKAYFQKAREHHPDLNQHDPTAQKKFVEVAAAYDILKDTGKRTIYDFEFYKSTSTNGYSRRGEYGMRNGPTPGESYSSNPRRKNTMFVDDDEDVMDEDTVIDDEEERELGRMFGENYAEMLHEFVEMLNRFSYQSAKRGKGTRMERERKRTRMGMGMRMDMNMEADTRFHKGPRRKANMRGQERRHKQHMQFEQPWFEIEFPEWGRKAANKSKNKHKHKHKQADDRRDPPKPNHKRRSMQEDKNGHSKTNNKGRHSTGSGSAKRR